MAWKEAHLNPGEEALVVFISVELLAHVLHPDEGTGSETSRQLDRRVDQQSPNPAVQKPAS